MKLALPMITQLGDNYEDPLLQGRIMCMNVIGVQSVLTPNGWHFKKLEIVAIHLQIKQSYYIGACMYVFNN